MITKVSHESIWSALVVLLMSAGMATSAGAQAGSRQPVAALSSSQLCCFSLSPDGRTLVWEQSGASDMNVMVYDLTTRTLVRKLTLGRGAGAPDLKWQDERTLLIMTRPEQRYFAVDVQSGRARQLAMSGDLLAWGISSKPHTVVMSAPYESVAYCGGFSGFCTSLALIAVNTHTGNRSMIARGDGFTDQWLTDPQGQPIARAEWNSKAARYEILAHQNGHWERVYRRTDGVKPRLWGLSADRKAILATMPDARGVQRLWSIPLDASPPTRLLAQVKQSVTGVEFSRSGKPLYVLVGGASAHTVWLDSTAKISYESVARAFPGRKLSNFQLTADGKQALVEVKGLSAPPQYYLINLVTHRAQVIGDTRGQLERAALAMIRPAGVRRAHESGVGAQYRGGAT